MKILLPLSIFIMVLFSGCSEDENNDTCKTCDNIEGSEICDNGDGTADYTITISGLVVYSGTIEIPEGYSIEDISCEDIEAYETNIELKE